MAPEPRPDPREPSEPVPDDFELRIYPDPVLLRRAEPVPGMGNGAGGTPDLRAAARAMFRIMYDAGGIGLAGPQVGWSRRVFVVNLTGDPERPGEELVFVNPAVESRDGSESLEEGCLSLPEIRADVVRPEQVLVRAHDAVGRPFSLTARGLLARCIQHEFDHLDGILFVRRLSVGARLKVKRALKELERRYQETSRAR